MKEKSQINGPINCIGTQSQLKIPDTSSPEMAMKMDASQISSFFEQCHNSTFKILFAVFMYLWKIL